MLQNMIEKLVYYQEKYKGLKEDDDEDLRILARACRASTVSQTKVWPWVQLGEDMQSLEGARDRDKGFEELGENMQSHEGAGEGDKELEDCGKNLEGLEDDDEALLCLGEEYKEKLEDEQGVELKEEHGEELEEEHRVELEEEQGEELEEEHKEELDDVCYTWELLLLLSQTRHNANILCK